MIWNFIRDFFVMYIFGGVTSNGDFYQGFIGGVTDGENFSNAYHGDFYVPIGNCFIDEDYSGSANYMVFGDWLSTTATIIVMCLIIWLFLKITIYLFKAGAGLLKW